MVLFKENPALGEDYLMITFYSGTPGSGKSYHMAKEMRFKLRIGRNIISTVNIDLNKVNNNGKKKIGDFVYIPILDLDPMFFYEYAYKNHVKGKEGQTIIIIDEAQILFNPREYQRKNRSDWILFFTKHRHLGYNIIMTSQFDRLIDRQIRSLFEYEVKHRKINNYGMLFLLPWTFFACVEYWYGNKLVVSRRFMRFNKKTASIYDSYVMYDEFLEQMVGAAGPRKHDTGNAEARCLPHAPPSDPDSTTDRVTEESDLTTDTAQEPDAEVGAGGPHRSGRFPRLSWWTKALFTAPIKSKKKTG